MCRRKTNQQRDQPYQFPFSVVFFFVLTTNRDVPTELYKVLYSISSKKIRKKKRNEIELSTEQHGCNLNVEVTPPYFIANIASVSRVHHSNIYQGKTLSESVNSRL